MKAWYKAVSYLHQNDTIALPMMVQWLNENTGAGITVADAKRLVTEDLKFAGSPIEAYIGFIKKDPVPSGNQSSTIDWLFWKKLVMYPKALSISTQWL